MASMSFVLLFGIFCFCSAAIPAKNPIYEVPIKKNLNNGDTLASNDAVVRLEGKLEKDAYHMYVSFKYAIPTITNITSLTIYLATEYQEISEIIFTKGQMDRKLWSKPWNPAPEGAFQLKDPKILPTESSVEIPREWIPTDVITGLSASIQGTFDDGTPITMNYYGLKNYIISLPDRYVVKNYMPVDLDVFFI